MVSYEILKGSIYPLLSVLLREAGGSEVKNQPAVQETQEMPVRSLGQEDPLEKEMATHSSILAWKIPWMEEPGRLQSIGSQRGTLYRLSHQWSFFCYVYFYLSVGLLSVGLILFVIILTSWNLFILTFPNSHVTSHLFFHKPSFK